MWQNRIFRWSRNWRHAAAFWFWAQLAGVGSFTNVNE